MQVEKVYLKPGEATATTDGWCRSFFDGSLLKGLMCGVKVDKESRRTIAIVVFDVSPERALGVEARPALRTSDETSGPTTGADLNLFRNGNAFKTLPNGVKVATLADGNKLEELPDGTRWVVLHPDGGFLGVRVDLSGMPAVSDFRTEIIRNLPPSDIVNAPLSEKIQIEGDCRAKTYTILGVLPYQGENGGGMPDADLATDPENVIRRVVPGTSVALAFDVACKKL